jgi:hypothetical protein
MTTAGDASSLRFAPVQGGPLSWLERGVRRGGRAEHARRAIAVMAITWLPLVILATIVPERPDPILFHLVVHARFLVAIPIFFAAERALEVRTARCLDRLANGGFAVEGPAAVRRLAARAAATRDSAAAEWGIVALAVAGSQAALWGLAGISTPIGHTPTPAHLWYGFVSLPIFQVLFYRWLWRWLVWAHLLFKLSQLELRPVATHPDRCGGLAFLSEPSVGFAPIVAASSVVLAGAFADRLLAGAPLRAFVAPVAVFLCAALLFTLGPLLVYARVLARARISARNEYGVLGLRYTRAFHARWIERAEPGDLLGTPDLQSLADLGGGYQVIREMTAFPFGARELAAVAAAALLPMLPLVLVEVPLGELLGRLARIAIGGLPR